MEMGIFWLTAGSYPHCTQLVRDELAWGGTSRSTTATSTKASPQNTTLHHPKSFTFIPPPLSLRTMQVKSPKYILVQAV